MARQPMRLVQGSRLCNHGRLSEDGRIFLIAGRLTGPHNYMLRAVLNARGSEVVKLVTTMLR